MPALSFEEIGGLSGPGKTGIIDYSKRGRDRDSMQTINFECDSTKPFSGLIHIQGSVDFNPRATTTTWSDLAEIELINEGGTFFLQTNVEMAYLRLIIKPDNYYIAKYSSLNPIITTNGDFSINGIGPINVSIGDGPVQIAAAINTHPNIILNGTIFADTVENNSYLRIYKKDLTPLILANGTNNPLAQIGIIQGTFSSGGVIKKITTMK